MPGKIPEDVERFLLQQIWSTEQLEVLLVVASQPEREWTVEEVYEVVKTQPGSIARHLQEFQHRGFLRASSQPPSYQFVSNDAHRAETLRKLAAIYRSELHRVIEVIYSKPSPAVQSFADAFRIRRKD